ncbi:2-oxo acid dehydrogenase subunit E2 [Natrinema caseinilyticum]|uniref:2-oxo acid dehydrogenase subunit E2 n=1 Tax=Natrinema caseinilyticum TaxID=2961570 RepID=UPI0020C3E3F0|nr:2-oxo acid dehydrogenase subunit E2 [Natrinema caseinilyticum]
MVQAVRMPMMGNTMESGLLVEWGPDEGEEVIEGDIIAVVESEKTTGEVEASRNGTLARVDVEAGEEVPPGTVMGIVCGPDERLDDAPAPRSRIDPESASGQRVGDGPDADSADEAERVASSAPSAASGEETPSGEESAASDEAGVRAAPGARKLATDQDIDLETVDGTGPEGAILRADVAERIDADERGNESPDRTAPSRPTFTSPSTRRLARELGVSIDDIEGTGIGDRVTESDVRAAGGQISRSASAEPATDRTSTTGTTPTDADRVGVTVAEERRLTGMRETIADRMSRSAQQAPHVTLDRTVAVERAFRTAEELASESDAPIGFTDVLVGATVRALDAHPTFNAWFEDETIRVVAERNVAVAVDMDGGLVTPVIRSADERTLASIASERRRLTAAILEEEYSVDDLQGATFTISNLGMFGVDSFDPIINPPQVAILGVGRVRDDGDGRTCTLSLSFDHRVVDGADAARFLDDLVAGVEAPSLTVADRSATSGASHEVTEPNLRTDAQSTTRGTSVEAAVTRDLEATAREIAAAHDWQIPSFEVELGDGDPSVTVESPAGASDATMKRLTYAACRDSAYADTISGIRDPEIDFR